MDKLTPTLRQKSRETNYCFPTSDQLCWLFPPRHSFPSTMDAPALRHCTGPFARLVGHIPPAMSAGKLISNETVFAPMLPDNLQPLFHAFIATLNVVAAEAGAQLAKAPSGLVLDYKAKVSPSAAGVFQEKVPLPYLVGKLKDLDATEKEAARVLDLSYNNLSADDIPLIVKCVDALQLVSSSAEEGMNLVAGHLSLRRFRSRRPACPAVPSALPSRGLLNSGTLALTLQPYSPELRQQQDPPSPHTTVILRNNRLWSCMPAVRHLLQHNSVEYVDVTINPIATLESKDDIKLLPVGELEKLIFLLPQHIKEHVLDIMTDRDRERMAIIEKAHYSFYERFSSNYS